MLKLKYVKRTSFQCKISLSIASCICLGFVWVSHSAWCQSRNSLSVNDRLNSLQRQLSTEPLRIDIRLQLAQIYLQVEDYRSASVEYQHIIDSKERNSKDKSSTINGYYGLGLSYAGLERFEDAVSAYKYAIKYSLERADIYVVLGAALSSLHRYDEALDAYNTAIKIQPDDAMIHHQIGNIYNKLGKHVQAIIQQEKAISILPTFAYAHYQLGLLYAQEKRYAESISAYEKAYTEDPELIEAIYNLSQVLSRNGNKEIAREKMRLFEERKVVINPIQQLREALQRTHEPLQKAKIQANIARHYLNDNNFEKAVREYENALDLNSKVVEAYNGIGHAYAMQHMYPDAIKSQKKALALRPDFAEAHAGIGLTYFLQDRLETALKHYREALSVSIKRGEERNLGIEVEIYKKIGLISIRQELYSDAISAYQALININPDDAEALHNIGVAYKIEGKINKALVSLLSAVDLATRRNGTVIAESEESNTATTFLPESYYLIGELYERQKQFEKAESAYQKSDLPKAYNALAQLSAKLADKLQSQSKRSDKLENAASYAETAISLNPTNASYHNTLAIIFYRMGDYLAADRSIRKAIELDPMNTNYQEGLKQIQGDKY